MFLIAKKDDTLAADIPICTVYGHFKVGQSATPLEESQKGFVRFAIKSGNDQFLFTSKKALGSGPFPAQLKPLKAFILHLQAGGEGHNLKFAEHELKVEFKQGTAGEVSGVSVEIHPTTTCLFEPKLIPADRQMDYSNIGSKLMAHPDAKWDVESGLFELGRLRVIHHVRFEEHDKQGTGVVPTKPCFYLVNNIKVTSGMVRRLA